MRVDASPEPLWQRRGREACGPALPLDGDVRCDVVVVGGGVAGLMCARVLAERGRDVVLLEADRCGSGASGRSSGFVTPDSEVGLATLVASLGEADARRLWQFVLGGVEDLRGVVLEHGLACDLEVQPSLLVAGSPRAVGAVEDEFEAHRALGFAADLHRGPELRRRIGTDAFRAGMSVDGTFALDPLAFCQGLRRVLVERGVRVHEGSRATSAVPHRVRTATGTVDAAEVVICADRWGPVLGSASPEVFHLQTFVLATAPLAPDALRRLFPSGPTMVWDTDLVYHYFRPTPDGRLLLGGGDVCSTYATSNEASLVRVKKKIERHFRKRFPQVAFDVVHGWSGLLGVSKDLIPVLSREPGLVVMGAATGLPWAAALGRLIADGLTTGRDELWSRFAPERAWPVSERVQRLVGRRLAFAVSHGLRKAGWSGGQGARGE